MPYREDFQTLLRFPYIRRNELCGDLYSKQGLRRLSVVLVANCDDPAPAMVEVASYNLEVYICIYLGMHASTEYKRRLPPRGIFWIVVTQLTKCLLFPPWF